MVWLARGRRGDVWLVALLALLGDPAACCRKEGEVASCEEQGLDDIPSMPDASLIRHLDLARNNITQLRNSSLALFPSLLLLSLSRNRLQELEPASFQTQAVLRHLDLSLNDLQYLVPDLLEPCVALQVLNLRGNHRLLVPENAPLLQSASLESLYLSSCGIARFYPQTFLQLPQLKVLDVHSNHLQSMSWPTTGLVDLDVADNPWTCGPDFEALKRRILEMKAVECVPQETTEGFVKTFLSWDVTAQVLFVVLPILLGFFVFLSITLLNYVIPKVRSDDEPPSPLGSNDHIYEHIPDTTNK